MHIIFTLRFLQINKYNKIMILPHATMHYKYSIIHYYYMHDTTHCDQPNIQLLHVIVKQNCSSNHMHIEAQFHQMQIDTTLKNNTLR
jgi:hypothetical protein